MIHNLIINLKNLQEARLCSGDTDITLSLYLQENSQTISQIMFIKYTSPNNPEILRIKRFLDDILRERDNNPIVNINFDVGNNDIPYFDRIYIYKMKSDYSVITRSIFSTR